jgi:imidazolonepropionase-like amidohydrolase
MTKSAALIALFVPCVAVAQQPTRETHIALTGATVIDGTGSAPVPNMTVIIRGDRIADVHRTGAKPVPSDATVRDATGLFVIPGLIDAHAHFGAAATTNGRLQRVVQGGVTSVRNMMADCRSVQAARQAAENVFEVPEFIYSAVIIGPAGNDDPRGASRPAGPRDPGCVRILDDVPLNAAEFVRGAKERGASAIKFYADVRPDLIASVTAEAHRQGLATWAHATVFPAKPSDLVRAGVDVLSHAPYLVWEAVDSLPAYHERVRLAPFSTVPVTHPAVERLLRSMAERGTILDATLLFFHLRATAPDTVAEDFRGSRDAFAAAARWGVAVVRRARELGVTVAAGTDALGAEAGLGPNLHRELELLVREAGFTPLQAIASATSVAARVLRAEARVGTVAPGKQADLLVLRADPTRDIRNTTAIAFVIRRGRIIEAGR